MKEGAFNQTFMAGADYAKWVDKEAARHQDADERSRFPRRTVKTGNGLAGARAARGTKESVQLALKRTR